MEGGELDKSEDATPFKLERSRRKGVVARGMDLAFLAGLAAFAGYAWVAGSGVSEATGRVAAQAFVTAPQLADGPDALLALTGQVLSRLMRPMALMAGSIFVLVLLFEVAQTGFVFSAAPLKPDFSRMNPGKGLKRLFTVRMLIETLKNVLKLAAYTLVAWLIVSAALRRSAAAADARALLLALAADGLRLLFGFLALALAFALLDQLLSRRMFRKQMRMSRREVRREHRDREGEPRIKQRRKQLHGQFAKAAEGLRAVKGSDVVVTNPTRLAIALRYDAATMEAPTVVAKGAREMAARIRSVAFTYGVTMIEDKALAQDLFRRCAIGGAVPEDQYRRVAQIYRGLRAAATPAGGSDA